MERALPLLPGAWGRIASANVFYQASHGMPQTIKEPERTRLSSSLDAAVRDKLLPAYRELHDFIRGEYLPRARTSVALSVLPLGASWYAYRIERATDSRLTPNAKCTTSGWRTSRSAFEPRLRPVPAGERAAAVLPQVQVLAWGRERPRAGSGAVGICRRRCRNGRGCGHRRAVEGLPRPEGTGAGGRSDTILRRRAQISRFVP